MKQAALDTTPNLTDISQDALENRTSFIHLVREGISGSVLKQVVDAVGHKELFIDMLDTTAGNFSRNYNKKRLTRSQSEGVLDTFRVFRKAAQVFGSSETAKEWLNTSIPGLGDQQPSMLCDTGEGRQMVLASLRKIEFGEFV